MEQKQKEPYKFKPINPTILQLQVLKEQGANPDAKYFQLINFKKYRSEQTTTIQFEKGIPSVTFDESGKEVRHRYYRDKKIECNSWVISKLFIPIKDFKVEIIKNAGHYFSDSGDTIMFDRIGVFLPTNVFLTVETPRALNDTVAKKLKSYIKDYCFTCVFRTTAHTNEYICSQTSAIKKVEKENDYNLAFNMLTQYANLSRKNWSFVKYEPKNYVALDPYNIKLREELISYTDEVI